MDLDDDDYDEEVLAAEANAQSSQPQLGPEEPDFFDFECAATSPKPSDPVDRPILGQALSCSMLHLHEEQKHASRS